jgi:hypothetical protein
MPELEDSVLTGASSTGGAVFSASTVPDLLGGEIHDVVQGANGFAGVGYQSNEVLEIGGVGLFSADGANWTEATNSDGSWADYGLEHIGALPTGGYVAIGFAPQIEDFTLEDGSVWRSADGTDWTSFYQLDGAFTYLVAAALGGPGMVVFAAEHADDDEGNVSSVIHAWFAPLSALET